MNKKFLLILPPTAFLIVIVGLAYSLLIRETVSVSILPTEDPPAASVVVEPSPTVTSSSTATSTSTPEPTDIPTATPSSTSTLVVSSFTPTNTPAVTETPTTTPTRAPSPTPTPEAVVVAANGMNLRSGPGTYYNIVGFLERGDFLNIEGRTANNEWIQVTIDSLDIGGWVSTLSEYVEIKLELETVPIAESPPVPTTEAPLLIDPANDFVASGARPDLIWEWSNPNRIGDYYYEVTIWLEDRPNPIDVAWLQYPCYRYDQIPEGKEGQIWEFQWQITVVKGIPGQEKQWSPIQQCGQWVSAEIRVWDPGSPAQTVKVSETSERRTVKVVVNSPQGDGSPPGSDIQTPPDDGGNDDDDGGGSGCSRC